MTFVLIFHFALLNPKHIVCKCCGKLYEPFAACMHVLQHVFKTNNYTPRFPLNDKGKRESQQYCYNLYNTVKCINGFNIGPKKKNNNAILFSYVKSVHSHIRKELKQRLIISHFSHKRRTPLMRVFARLSAINTQKNINLRVLSTLFFYCVAGLSVYVYVIKRKIQLKCDLIFRTIL